MDTEPQSEPKLVPESVKIMLGEVEYTVVDKDGLKTAVGADGKTFALSADGTVATQVVAQGETAETYVKDLESGTWAIKVEEALTGDDSMTVGGRRSRRRRSNKKKMSKGWGGSKKKKQKKRKGSKKRR